MSIFSDIRRHATQGTGAMIAAMQQARVRISDLIRDSAASATNQTARNKAFQGITDIYTRLADELDGQLEKMTKGTAQIARKATVEDAKGQGQKGLALKFDEDRLKRYWEMIHPSNAPSLVAVFTDKMAAQDIQDLRTAAINVFRVADLESLTAKERVKRLQSAWDELAGNADPRRFIDKGNREWTNARYLTMLVRTTQARVAREAAIDTLVENGDDLMRVVAVGENCDTCEAWAGLIVSVTGTNKDFPSYEDAIDAGWGHPQCDCQMERVDETIDGQEISAQQDAKNPGDWTDLESVSEYREKAGLEPEDAAREQRGDWFKEAAEAYVKELG